jgi:hypothetical protein
MPGQDAQELAFYGSVAATTLQDGTLVVADRDEGTLMLFDVAGELRARSGTKGSGPGEYRHLREHLPAEMPLASRTRLRMCPLLAKAVHMSHKHLRPTPRSRLALLRGTRPQEA